MHDLIARSKILQRLARTSAAGVRAMPLVPEDSSRQRMAWWPPVLLSFLLWLMVTLMLILVMLGDVNPNPNARNPRPWRDEVQSLVAMMLPLAVLGVMLAGLFARTGERWLKQHRIGLLYLMIVSVFLPLYMYYTTSLMAIARGKPLPYLWDVLPAVDGQSWFIDGVSVSMVFASQVGYAFWRHERQRQLALQASRSTNLALRLSLLQGQLEPNFLLSTLDGISSLVQEAERSLAVRALARLSDLLRYALRASGQAQGQSMADEMEFMHHYLALQALRTDLHLQLHWHVAEEEWAEWACPPLLLVPLLELAIKHGTAHPMLDLHLTLGIESKQIYWRMHWSVSDKIPDAALPVDTVMALATLPEAAAAPVPAFNLSTAPQYLALATRLNLQFDNEATLSCRQDGTTCRIDLMFPATPP